MRFIKKLLFLLFVSIVLTGCMGRDYNLEDLPELVYQNEDEMILQFEITNRKERGDKTLLTLRSKHNDKIVGIKIEVFTNAENAEIRHAQNPNPTMVLGRPLRSVNWFQYSKLTFYGWGLYSRALLKALVELELAENKSRMRFMRTVDLHSRINIKGRTVSAYDAHERIDFEREIVSLYTYGVLGNDPINPTRFSRHGFTMEFNLSDNWVRWVF